MIVYADYINGDDGAGDGTIGNPYKTLSFASTGLTGGDEVRVAKSDDDVTLTGLIDWVDGQTNIIGVGTLFSSELVAGDVIRDPHGNLAVVISVNDDFSLDINYPFVMELEGGSIRSQPVVKVGVIPVTEGGDAFAVVGEGLSRSSKLLISGGWDLGLDTKTGVTTFIDTAGGTNAISITEKRFIDIADFGFISFNGGGSYDQQSAGIGIYNSTIEQLDSGISISNIKSNDCGQAVWVDGCGIEVDGLGSNGDAWGVACGSNFQFNSFKNIATYSNQNGNMFFDCSSITLENFLSVLSQTHAIQYGGNSVRGNNRFKNVRAIRAQENGFHNRGSYGDSFNGCKAKFCVGMGWTSEQNVDDFYGTDLEFSNNGDVGFDGTFVRSGKIGVIECNYNGTALQIAGGDGNLQFGKVVMIGNGNGPTYNVDLSIGSFAISIEELILVTNQLGTFQPGGEFDWPASPTDIIPFKNKHKIRSRLQVGDEILDVDASVQTVIAVNANDVQIATPYTGTPGENTITVNNKLFDFIDINYPDINSISARYPHKTGIMCSNYQGTGLAENFLGRGRTRGNTTVARGGSGKCVEFEPFYNGQELRHSFFIKADALTAKTISIYARKDADFNGLMEIAVYQQNRLVADFKEITPLSNDTWELKQISVSGIELQKDGLFEVVVNVRGGDWGKCFIDDLAIGAVSEVIPHVFDILSLIENIAFEFIPENSDSIAIDDTFVILGLDPFDLIDGNGQTLAYAILDTTGNYPYGSRNVAVNQDPVTVDCVFSVNEDAGIIRTAYSRFQSINFSYDYNTFELKVELGNGDQQLIIPWTPIWGKEYHVAYVRESAGGTHHVFIEGIEVFSGTENSIYWDSYSDLGVTVGQDTRGFNSDWNGTFRWGRFSSTPLWITNFTPPKEVSELTLASPTECIHACDGLANNMVELISGIHFGPSGGTVSIFRPAFIGSDMVVEEDVSLAVV